MADSNYGVTLTRAGSALGQVIVVDYPEVKTNKINVTNHASSGVVEYIYDGLVGLEDISLSLIAASGVLNTLKADMNNKVVNEYVISDEVDSWTFDALVTSIKRESADAQSPDVAKYTVVLSPTGALS